jgi:hypothetical protein
MNEMYKPPPLFQGREFDPMKTHKITDKHFADFPDVTSLIDIFKKLHLDIQVIQVWFLRRRILGMGLRNITLISQKNLMLMSLTHKKTLY